MPAIKSAARAKSTGLANRLSFEEAVDRVSFVQVELRQLYAERDAAVQQAQLTHAATIAELEDELNAKLALCEKFAAEHRDELLPGKGKSNETPLSRWGFRTGMPQLKLLSKWSWAKVLEQLVGVGARDCIRVKEEVDKEALLKLGKDGTLTVAAEDPAKAKTHSLAVLGVRIVQDETFFIEAKVDGEKGGAS